MNKFAGGDDAWKEWSFDFKVIAEAINPSLTKWFEVSERPDATEEALKREYGKPDVDPKDIGAKSKELSGLLCILTEGEAETMVRGQTDGFSAWALLHSTYSRTTLARTVRVLKEALVPRKAATISEVILKITEWENKVADLEKMEENYKFQPMIKIALLTEICPEEIKDLIFQNMDVRRSDDKDLYK